MKSWSFSIIFIIKLLIIVEKSVADHVHGCGGFIKSHADMDFSKVEVQLLTKTGIKKDSVEANPTNGYYFLPIYEKGSYVLKVVPPAGWSFDREQFEIEFDGETDPCSLEQDINFVFKGFGITGRVDVLGQTLGAPGVEVQLIGKGNEIINKATTNNQGRFSFTPLLPGEYILRATHATWYLAKSELAVKLTNQNYVIPEKSLLVSGFDVNGKVKIDASIGLLIYAKKGQNTKVECSNIKIPDVVQNNQGYESKALCYTTTNPSNKEFTFKNVNPGEYLIVPYIEQKSTKMHISPESIKVQVLKDTVNVNDMFEVTGITVNGRVLRSGDVGVKDAKITVAGNLVATTDTNGRYELQNLKPATYTIQVEATDLEFDDHIARISLTNPSIPDIMVARSKVCGQIVSDKTHTVSITKLGSTYHTEVKSTAPNGEFCTYLAAGKYTIEVLTSSQDKNEGIQFFPVTQTIEVGAGQINDIVFSQLKATASGRIECLPDAAASCDDIPVTVISSDTDSEVTTTTKDRKYSLLNVLPGTYQVNILKPELCWEAASFQFVVKSKKEQIPTFKHTGYAVTVISSHATEMVYSYKGQADIQETIQLIPGVNNLCVPKQGSYDIKFVGCHIFDSNTPTTFSTVNHQPVTVNAESHKHGIRILSEVSTQYTAVIEQDGKKINEVTFKEEPNKVDGYYAYRHDFQLKKDEKIKIIPAGANMLFKPDVKEITGASECYDVAFNFIATKGLVLHGRVVPAIQDVKIMLNFPKNTEMVAMEANTDKKGEFVLGPIDSTIDIELTAEKENYVFSAFDKQTNSFKGHKLCEIIVKVLDEEDNKLSGVLLSLSGGESYRKNLITGDDGTIKFHSLSPSQYYLRPMMKEYKFDPSSKVIDIQDGETVEVSVKGKRVAWSLYGTVRSLNGEPFSNVNVIAAGDENCEGMEEAQTEFNGNYRIKGLMPGCRYRIKIDAANTPDVDRSIPTEKTVEIGSEDTHGVNFIGVSPLTYVDVIARVVSSANDYYKTLKISLYKKDSDSPIYSQKVEGPLNPKGKLMPSCLIFFPRIPFDSKQGYYIELSSTLSSKQYKFHLPNIEFTANQSNRFFEISFKPEIIAPQEINQNSLPALIFISLVGFVFFKQDLAMQLLESGYSRVSGVAKDVYDKSRKTEAHHESFMDEREIDQLAQNINSIRRKKTKKVN